MKAIILAAGRSTRTYPLTLTRPKPLLPLWGKPLLAHTLAALRTGGVKDVVVVVNYKADMIRDFLGPAYGGVNVAFVEQPQPRGTADAVARAAEAAGDGDVVILGGDDYFGPRNVAALVASPGAALLGIPVRDVRSFGALTIREGRLEKLTEKPPRGGAGVANAGAYKFPAAIYEFARRVRPSPRGELEFTQAVAAYARAAEVRVLTAAEPWVPIALATDLLACQIALWPRPQPLVIDPGGAVPEGAVVGGRSCLGRGCRVGENAVIEGSLLLDEVVVEDGACVTGSVLGEGARVGAAAVVDGAVVGDGAMIGTAAVVEAGARIWPGVEIAECAYVTGAVTG